MKGEQLGAIHCTALMLAHLRAEVLLLTQYSRALMNRTPIKQGPHEGVLARGSCAEWM